MARAASKSPGGTDANLYDLGRAVALWVSAFEILAHDGHRADLGRVLQLLSRVEWLSPKLKVQDREVTYKRKSVQTNLAGALYERLNRVRNDFVHGEPVTVETLKLEKPQKPVHWFAASLFRLALTAFLNLRLREIADEKNSKGFDRSACVQRRSEEAILIADA